VRTIRSGLVVGLIAQLVLLIALWAAVGLGPAGWVSGLGYGAVMNALLARGLTRSGRVLGPADRITLLRATLVGGVAGLTADSFQRSIHPLALVVLAAVALVLDAVDGQVARRTGTTSGLGARFDMEVDAFLILVLSVYVAQHFGWWILAIGAARYAYAAAGLVLPWLRRPAPARYWCKVVAAIQGIVLTFAAAGFLPRWAITTAIVVALALLAESFGREAWWLSQHRPRLASAGRRERLRPMITRVLSVAAFVIVWAALVVPNRLEQLTPSAFAQIPIEGLVLIGLGLFLPRRPRQALAALAGVLLGLLVVVKILDVGFYEELDRPFNPVIDWSSLGPALGVVQDSIGRAWADTAAVFAVLLIIAIVVTVTWSVMRMSRITAGRRGTAARWVSGLAVVWIGFAAVGVSEVPGKPVASRSTSGLAADQVREVSTAIKDQHNFESSLARPDSFSNSPGSDLLTGLRGKDVIFAFVESYGQVAVQGTTFSPGVDAVLNAGTKTLDAAGFSSRSAFLTSPTFGGISWLAHSTFQSGLWINNQQRYDELVNSNRFTLSDAFKRAGWRTVGDVPSNTDPWPEGTSFYHYDKLYDVHNVGYAGPKFSYASMPDQYTLSAFQQRELTPNHAPLMAEIDLVSSHTPWTPLPRMVPWNAVGNGSVFDGMPAQGPAPSQVWPNAKKVQATYGKSIQYSLNALISFVTNLHDDNLVLVLLGDHQPATIVSRPGASHDVPISIIAKDPGVMRSISSWNWQDGLLPDPQAPVWPMDAFRNRFLTAFGPQSGAASLPMASHGH
jgi:phosphatidylglycerophosphate synthase